MITLHESNITSFPHDNGIGVLRDVIRAYAEEELNGMFEFYMEYDSEGHLVNELKEERIIKAKAQDKLGYQLFRIYSITKNHENDNLIIRAQHITYDLADNFVEKLEANNLTKKQVMEKIGASTVLPHPFNVTSSNTTTMSSTKLYRTNPLQMIAGMDGSVLQIWGGQLERDNFNLILHDRRGHDDGVTVTYEKNITGLTAEFDIGSLVTRIFPFVYIEATDDSPERLITVSGKYIDSPLMNNYSKIYIEPIDYSHDERIDIQDKTDAQIRQQLESAASTYFEETGNDKVKASMDVAFIHLWETEEYKDVAPLELVGMGDSVTIHHSRLKVDATAIVNYIRYDCIAEINEEVKLGNVKAGLTDSVNKINTIERKVEQAESNANQAIVSANGKNTTYYGPDEPTTGMQKGDLWFKVIDGQYHKTYRFDGIEWQLIIDIDSQEAKQQAQQAKDRADDAVNRANQATQQATNAINQAQTAFDEAQNALGTASNAYDIATTLQGDVSNLSTLVDEHTGQISSITQSVTGLQTQVSDIEGNVSTLTQTISSLTTRVGDAEGNITALQQTSSSLAGRLSDAEGNITTLTAIVDGLQTTVTNVQGDVSSVTQLANALQVRMTDAEGNISTLTQTASSLQSTISDVRADLDGLEIGGRNLLRELGGDNYNLNQIYSSDRSRATVVTVDGKKWIRYTGYQGLRLSAIDVDSDTLYTYSFMVYANESSEIRLGFYSGGGYNYKYVNVSTSPKKVYVSGKTKAEATSDILHIWNLNTDGIYYFSDFKLEKGNKATDWTPAVEDMATQSQITQLYNNINLRVEKGDVINQINISDENILIDGNKLHITATTTIDNAAIKSAAIESLDAGKITTGVLDAGKVTLINLVGLDIYGSRFRSSTGSDFMEIIGGNVRLQNTNGRYLDMNPAGFYGYNANDSVRFQADQTLVTSSALGTTFQNVYLGARNEARVVDIDSIPGDGQVPSYTYLNMRAAAFIGNHIEVNHNGTNLYLRPRFNGEVRVTAAGTTGAYRNIKALGFVGDTLEVHPETAGVNLYLKTHDRVRIVRSGTTGAYMDLQTRDIQARTIRFNTEVAGSHFYIGSSSGETRFTDNNFDNYRPIRVAGVMTGHTNLYLRTLTSGGEVKVVNNGFADWGLPNDQLSFRAIRASAFNEASSRAYKTNIEKYTDSALDVVNDLTVVTYNLKDDLVNGIVDKKIGFISEDSPKIATRDGTAIQTYQLSAYNTKAIQELDSKFTSHEDRINILELENQYLRQKIKQLEEMVA